MNMTKFIETENFLLMNELIEKLIELNSNPERMGLAYGNFGLGKTFSLEKLTDRYDAVLLRARETWSVTTALQALGEAIGVTYVSRANDMFNRIVEELIKEPRVIIVDEADKLLGDRFRVLEAFRDIHDIANVAFLFVGMESFDNRLKNHRHFHSRVVAKVNFKETPLEDIKKFCELSDLKIESDLVEYFAKKYPNLRQIKVLILRIESFWSMNDIGEINLKNFKISGVEYATK